MMGMSNDWFRTERFELRRAEKSGGLVLQTLAGCQRRNGRALVLQVAAVRV